MKQIHGAICLVWISVCSVTAWASGNGSSGIGNSFVIDGNLATILPEKSIVVDRDEIRDAKTEEKLFRITPIPEAELRKYRNQLVKAKLGSVEGLEYVPNIGDANAGNFWVVCRKKGKCLKLLPLSRTNSKVPAIIGALSRIQKSRGTR